jgi:hypothetical protein
MSEDTHYKSNGKTYCVRKYDDGSYKIWNGRNKVIGEVKTLAKAFEVIKADSGGNDIRER